jgi:zinc transporter ZupT
VTTTTHNHFENLKDFGKGDKKAVIASILFWITICIHSTLEGMGIGITSIKTMWTLYIAVISHELILAFTLGAIISKSKMKAIFIIFFIFTFSLANPFGILIGFLFSFFATRNEVKLNLKLGF